MGQAQESVVPKPARRVLIIDDEDYVRQYMSLMIGSWGFDVATSGSVQTKDLARLTRSDLIFIDMMMPGVDGIQVLETLSRQGVKSSIVLMAFLTRSLIVLVWAWTRDSLMRRMSRSISSMRVSTWPS